MTRAPHVVDAVVIGGGITGMAVAYQLARANLGVILLERGSPNRGASGRNAGSLHFQLQHQAVDFGPAQRARLPVLVGLMKAGAAAWRRLAEALGDAIGLAQHGGLMVAETPAEVARLHEKHALERALGVETRLCDPAEIRALAPRLSPGVLAATFCADEGQADPRRATFALGWAAEAHGAAVRAGEDVVHIARDGARYRLTTRRGDTIAAAVVVIAAGAWSGAVATRAGVTLPIEVLPVQLHVTEPAPPLLPVMLQHVGARLSLKQTATGHLLIGGGWPARIMTAGDRSPEDGAVRPLYESLARNVAVAVRVLPALRDTGLLRAWSGLAAWTPDGLPVLGEVPSHPGLFAVYGGNGFTLGPILAELVAERIARGRASLDLEPLSPARFSTAAPREASAA